MVCPDCNKEAIRIAARIEGVWRKCWLCECQPTEKEIEKWESIRTELIKKHWNPSHQEKKIKEDENLFLYFNSRDKSEGSP